MIRIISVIVPVYNVEPYLPKCLDSIITQTYRNLEILLIDDGSTDSSGEICDRYADRDPRIQVFHTENHGLSCARNLGLNNAKGKYIGFVDSDDWIENDMFECLYLTAQQTHADVVECSIFYEYTLKTEVVRRQQQTMSGMDAIDALLYGKLANTVWSKIYNRNCFGQIRFPEGRVFEDVSTTYLIFASARIVSTISGAKYHYRQRRGSINNTYDMNNLIGYWVAVKERYEILQNRVDDRINKQLARDCAVAVARTWAHYYDCKALDRAKQFNTILEMNCFSKENLPLFGQREWELTLRCGVFLSRFYSPVSFQIAWVLQHLRIRHEKSRKYLFE